MNILIIGSGAIGIALGASMISEGANVSFYATKNTKDALKENGIKRTGIFKNLQFTPDEFKVYDKYDEIKDTFDYIFISTKTNVNNEVSKQLDKHRHILKDDAKIIIFQNGFANDEYYLRYFSRKQVFSARVITGFMRPEKHISEITVHTAPILIGSLQNKEITDDLKQIANMISNSGIPSDTSDCIDKYLWAKMLYNCALNPLSALLSVKYGELTENKYTIDIMNNIIDEIFNVIEKSEYSTFWDSADSYREEFYTKLVPDTYNHESSMLQDFRRKQFSEIDSLTGRIIKLGELLDVNVKTNRVIYDLIKVHELNF